MATEIWLERVDLTPAFSEGKGEIFCLSKEPVISNFTFYHLLKKLTFIEKIFSYSIRNKTFYND